jgi:hypothetical protein
MKKKERRLLEVQLTNAIQKILTTHYDTLAEKIEKVVKKSISQVTKKSKKKITAVKTIVPVKE